MKILIFLVITRSAGIERQTFLPEKILNFSKQIFY